ETPAGLAAASRWLGVRTALQQDEVFPTLPSITVALWQRHLAYGAALGLAHAAVEPIRMGAESDTRAWSSYGGTWRAVRVDYPRWLPVGWGRRPQAALLRAVPMAIACAALLAVLAPPFVQALAGLGPWAILPGAAVLLPPGLAGLRATALV